MITESGHILSIIECDNCGYSRSSEEDGRMFHEVCGICYLEQCPTPVTEVNICDQCNKDEELKSIKMDDFYSDLIDPGESLFT